MTRGIAARDRGDHEAALTEFRDAQRLAPGANVPNKLAGETLEKLARYSEAIAAYRRYLELTPNGKSAPELRTRIDRIERAHFATLVFACRPNGARVIVDGREIGIVPLAPRIVPAPKSYEVTVEAQGFVAASSKLDVTPGAQFDVPCSLAPLDLRPKALPESPPVTKHVDTFETPRPWYRRPVVVGPLIGAAVAAVSVGLYLTFSDDIPDSAGGQHPLP